MLKFDPSFTFLQVEEELLEQEFLERCFQEMLEEEDQDWFIPARDLPSGVGQIQQQLSGLSVSDGNAEDIAVSLAAQSSFKSLSISLPDGKLSLLSHHLVSGYFENVI